jgi:hypothetical protein
MEERELTQLLQQVGDRVTPGPAPVQRIVAAGEALSGRRSRRVRVFAVAAAAAAVVGGGSVAAVVLDLPPGSSESADSAAGGAADGAGGGEESAPQAGPRSENRPDDGVAAADVVDALRVAPDVVAPGERIAVTPRADVLGFGYVWRLERLTDEGWTWEYTLESATGAGAPTWQPAGEVSAAEDVLVPYKAPIALVVPPVAAPGDYRVCQNEGPQDRCGQFTVAD